MNSSQNQSLISAPDLKLIPQISGIRNFPQVVRLPVELDSSFLDRKGLGSLKGKTDLSYYQALVNPENGHAYNMVTDMYNLLPYPDVIDSVENALRKHPEFGTSKRSIMLHPDGDRMHVNYRFPSCTENIGIGDPVEFQIGVWTSYDSSWPFRIDGGAYRLICTNGLTVGTRVVYFKHRHTDSLNLDRIATAFDGALERYADETGLWKKWVNMHVNAEDYESIMRGMRFGKKAQNLVEEEVEVSSGLYLNDPTKMRTLTVWLFFNILAQYITHKVRSPMRQEQYRESLRSGFERYRHVN